MKNSVVKYDQYDPNKINYRETILAVGNTYMGLRGIEDENPEGTKHGLYVAGVFDKSECLVSEIINFPNFLMMRVEIEDEIFSAEICKVSDYSRSLDVSTSTVTRSVTFESKSGKKIKLESRRFVSYYDLNCGAVEVKVTSLNFSGTLRMYTEFDGTILSREGSYLYDESVKHYHLMKINDQYEDNFYTRVLTREKEIFVDFSTFIGCDQSIFKGRARRVNGEKIREWIDFEAVENVPATITKYFSVVDSRFHSKETLKSLSETKLERMKGNGFDEELRRSNEILKGKWDRMNVEIEGDDESDLALRYTIYQLLILGSETNPTHGIGSKGLSTEHYGGHYFWCNEIYFQPLFLNTNPQIAKNLLKFRLNSLGYAQEQARHQGFEGSLWSWQSTSKGDEGIRHVVSEDGVVHRRAILDQYHLVSDVAFGCFRYYFQTHDHSFFRMELSRLIVECMRFWRSFIFQRNDRDADVYHMKHVMGPDEYHRHVDDNFYTNYLTQWVFREFLKYYDNGDDKIRYDVKRLNHLRDDELEDFRLIADKIFIPAFRDKVIPQFDGYFDLKDLVIEGFDEGGLPLFPDSNVGEGMADAERQHALELYTTNTQLLKQADAIMPFVMMPFDFDTEIMEETLKYYAVRTLHFSSLSPGNYAEALTLVDDVDQALDLFKMGANMDLKDIKHESETGPHTACQGATYQAAVKGFAGIRPTRDYLDIRPRVPKQWKSIELYHIYRGMHMKFKVDHETMQVTMLNEGSIDLRFKGEVKTYTNTTGGEYTFSLKL